MSTLLAAGIHDAKNSLASLTTWLAEARKQGPSPALDEASRIAARLSHQLVELLALFRAGDGSLRLSVEDHDLSDFCDELLGEFELPPESSLVVEKDLAAALNIGAWAFDAYLVKLALLDALRNAQRHAAHRIRLGLQAAPEGGICFVVSDDGPGYPQEILDGEATAVTAGSSGLGLSFARQIAQAHATPNGRRGAVLLTNDEGARFTLRLP